MSQTPSKSKNKVPSPEQGLPRIGVLGLGIMGSAMSFNLMQAGHEVWGHDPSAKARKALTSAGGLACTQPRKVMQSCAILITSLPHVKALDEVVEELLAHGQKASIVIETSTLPITNKQQARQRLKAVGIEMLDCPLSGTGAQARNKDLTVYASGSTKAIRKVSAVFDSFARQHFDLGEFGNGMRMKLMANLLVAIHNVSTAEALLLGQRMGISIDRAVEVLSGGAGGSRMLSVRGPLMQKKGWEKATMKVSIWQKDMQLIAQALSEAGVPSPLFAATQPLYHAAMALGHGDHDTASVFDVLDRMSRK
ncbi:MAG: hypothetical protein RL111_1071 [Pseudomonadota bacterium]|jgi:3-hydroxyisobutyrate dehydrogenase-like beta-hydroxyacid dehydrogenase